MIYTHFAVIMHPVASPVLPWGNIDLALIRPGIDRIMQSLDAGPPMTTCQTLKTIIPILPLSCSAMVVMSWYLLT